MLYAGKRGFDSLAADQDVDGPDCLGEIEFVGYEGIIVCNDSLASKCRVVRA